MKTLLYSTPVQSEEDFVARIAVASGVISEMPALFHNIRQSLTLIPRTVADFQHPCRNNQNAVLHIFAHNFSGKTYFYQYVEVKI